MVEIIQTAQSTNQTKVSKSYTENDGVECEKLESYTLLHISNAAELIGRPEAEPHSSCSGVVNEPVSDILKDCAVTFTVSPTFFPYGC